MCPFTTSSLVRIYCCYSFFGKNKSCDSVSFFSTQFEFLLRGELLFDKGEGEKTIDYKRKVQLRKIVYLTSTGLEADM